MYDEMTGDVMITDSQTDVDARNMKSATANLHQLPVIPKY